MGGDRFAANLVILPHGLYYGGLTPEAAVDVAAAHRTGRLVPRWLRGRAALSHAVQAAQHHARTALANEADDDRLLSLASLAPLAVHHADERSTEVVLAYGAESLVVTVHAGVAPTRELLTCGATAVSPMRVWELVDLVKVPRS